jgi:TPR repeat protein
MEIEKINSLQEGKMSFETLKEELTDKLVKNSYSYVEIDSLEELKKIHALWCQNIIGTPKTAIEYLYFGSYNKKIGDYPKMKEYFLSAIENGNIPSSNELGYHYEHVEKNYDEAKKFYLLGVEKGYVPSIRNLAKYYQTIEANYSEMKKICILGIEKGCAFCMNNLGYYYHHIKKNRNKAIKFYKMAIDKNYPTAMYNLGFIYQHHEKNYRKMKKYYTLAIKHGNLSACVEFAIYYHVEKKKITKSLFYYIKGKEIDKVNEHLKKIITDEIPLDKYFYESLPLLKSLQKEFPDTLKIHPLIQSNINLYTKEIDILENAFKYLPEADGYEKAKEEFNSLLSRM